MILLNGGIPVFARIPEHEYEKPALFPLVTAQKMWLAWRYIMQGRTGQKANEELITKLSQ
jgi:hypothetical protein